jgi:hypothetical protein
MGKDIRKKKRFIIEKSEQTKRQLEELKGEVPQVKNDLGDFETRLDKDIYNLAQTSIVWQAIPDEELADAPPELETLTASGSNLVGGFFEDSLRLRERFRQIENTTKVLMGTSAVTTSTIVNIKVIALDAAKSVAPKYPKVWSVLEKAKAPSPLEQRAEISAKLKDIHPRLAEKFDGAWKTLEETTNPDRFRQAAHSMREVLSDFEHTLAPDKDVMRTEWFKRSGKKKPIQRLRVKFAIIGTRKEETIAEEDIDGITRLMDDARDRYKFLSKIAHARKKKTEKLFPLTESYLSSCQEIIRTILELREKFFQPPENS